ncbi:MAG TPA: glycosyltransferase family 2 protein [Anaeromyxobacter sp.]
MRLSFVVPTRNQARFIRRCLDSCIAQGIAGGEILVQDGLSIDGTQEILASYGQRIDWVSERDAGQADAVNKAVARARGEVIAWVNSDDYYPDPACVGAALAELERPPEADLVYGDGLVVSAGGTPIRPYRNRTFATVRDLLVAPIGPSQPATFFRRRLFLEVGGLRTDLHYGLDYELWLRMFPRARRIRRLERPLACMTFHADAKSTRAMLPQIREVRRFKAEHARANGLGLVDRLRVTTGIGAMYAYWLAVRTGLRKAT